VSEERKDPPFFLSFSLSLGYAGVKEGNGRRVGRGEREIIGSFTGLEKKEKKKEKRKEKKRKEKDE